MAKELMAAITGSCMGFLIDFELFWEKFSCRRKGDDRFFCVAEKEVPCLNYVLCLTGDVSTLCCQPL